MTAYNYDSQTWVEGEAGARLMLTQLESTLALAQSTRGIEFAKFEGFASRESLVRHLERGIAECRAELNRHAQTSVLASELGVS